jgi:DNA invertase Pin-like site-specific DNA recombinase
MSENKITPSHLKRQAVVYIRQSSMLQVEKHQESQKRQYQLEQTAQTLGWPAAHCVVIDDDLGISGAQSHNRPGYQKLISKIALREVGIVLGLEVSRLARNSLDWYQLLELAAAFDVLIADEDGVYDVNEFNDRLLLGLKGTISEVELYQIRTRLSRGRLNKAQRGDLRLMLPIGIDWDERTQKPRLAVDQGIRHAVALVFDLFRQIGSIRGVLLHCLAQNIELPYQKSIGSHKRRIGWRSPSYDAVRHILINPVYAGVYCYGKVTRRYDPLTQQTRVEKRPRSEWEVFLPDNHPGYITLAEYEENQQTIANNRFDMPQSTGAARKGEAVLQGLVFCEHCGRRMRVRYSGGRPYYLCDRAKHRYGDPICNRASAQRVDAQVVDLVLSVINEGTLELSLANDEHARQQQAAIEQHWRDKLKRLHYTVELARRRYDHVDPANRLVAYTLESEWNQALDQLAATQRAYHAQKPTEYQIQSSIAVMREIIANLRHHWFASEMPVAEQKEILRCLLERVVLARADKMIRTTIHWQGGACSKLDVPQYLFSSPYLYWRISELARTQTDREIAATLNEEGVQTVKGRPWSDRRVMDFRLSNSIPSGFTTRTELRLTESGYITTPEAAQQLGISVSAAENWFKQGILPGKRDSPGATVWIAWSEDLLYRLQGSAKPDPRMTSVRSLCRTRNQRPPEIYAWANENGHGIFRLRRGTSWRFYILPNDVTPAVAV